MKTCSITNGKHKWTFVKNVSKATMTFGPKGSHGTLSVRGLYRCECGETRIGKCKNDAPGSDLREHFPRLLA